MNVVNLDILADLDMSMLFLVLMSLLGAVILLLLAYAAANAGSSPALGRALMPVMVGRVLPGAMLPPRILSRAGGASRAPPGSSLILRTVPVCIRARR